MKYLKLISPFLIAGILLLSCENETEKDKKATIYGFVTDYKTYEPIQGAEVVLYSGAKEIARSQLTGMDGRYEFIIDKSITVDYTSFYVKALGYEAISTIGLEDAFSVNLGDKRQIDLAMFDRSAFPVYMSIKYADMTNYFYTSSITIINPSSNNYRITFIKYETSYVNGGFEERWAYSFNLSEDDEYKYSSLWFEGDRFVIKTMGMSRSFIATSDSF